MLCAVTLLLTCIKLLCSFTNLCTKLSSYHGMGARVRPFYDIFTPSKRDSDITSEWTLLSSKIALMVT